MMFHSNEYAFNMCININKEWHDGLQTFKTIKIAFILNKNMIKPRNQWEEWRLEPFCQRA